MRGLDRRLRIGSGRTSGVSPRQGLGTVRRGRPVGEGRGGYCDLCHQCIKYAKIVAKELLKNNLYNWASQSQRYCRACLTV
jgi:hypothetical protein